MENSTSKPRFLTIEIRHRYTALLILTVTLLSALPLIKGDGLAILSIKLGLAVVLLAGIYAGPRIRRDLILGGVLGIPVVLGRWLPEYSTDVRVFLAIDIVTAVFLMYTTIIMLNQVLGARRVTLDTIAGAVCAYFLIGLAWAFVYRAMFVLNPHSFRLPSGSSGLIFENQNRSEPRLTDFAYYSFTALTTTGFGDITPSSGPSRTVSIVEAVAGQLFLAVLIARLVSLELVHSRRDRE